MTGMRVQKGKLTYVDIARLVGVGASTVSRVLNNSQRVAPETRKKILQAIRTTGYRPSSAARMLVRRRSETIGLIFEKEHVNTYYGTRLVEGISECLTDKGMKLAMSTVPWYASTAEIEELPLLRSLSVDGLILDVAQIRGDLDQLVARLGLPYVFVNPPGYRPFNTIMPDDVAVARQATRYLIDQGHRRIAFLPPPGSTVHSSISDRMKGYAEALLKADLRPVPLWDVPLAKVDNPVADYLARAKAYRQEYGCTAVVTYNAIEAARLMYACYQLGIRVPEDLSLASCDYDPTADLPPRRITCFHFDRIEMGRQAVRMLEERISQPEKDAASITVAGTRIEGETVVKAGG